MRILVIQLPLNHQWEKLRPGTVLVSVFIAGIVRSFRKYRLDLCLALRRAISSYPSQDN